MDQNPCRKRPWFSILGRQSALLGLVVASIAVSSAADAQPSASPIAPDDYFLSSKNPLATADQRDLENLALQIIKMPAVLDAKEIARSRWKTLIGSKGNTPSPEAWAAFDNFINEYVFHYTLKAVNSDPNYPRIVRFNMLPHNQFGKHVPGSRQGGGDNPDNTYALIPIEYGATYELTGKRLQPAPADVTYSLMGNLTPSMTLASLEGRDVKVHDDGSFTITLATGPADGRSNYIQTQPDSRYLFIRESRGDWRELPSAIRIKRIDPPRTPPLTIDQLAARAARYVIDDIPEMYWWIVVMAELPRNEMTQPTGIARLGGLVSQQISLGHLQLTDDDALIVTVGLGGAGYHNIVLHDYWFDALDYPRHTSSFNNVQAAPNSDGTITYVVSIRDPGVYNWLDPTGLHELLVANRWQELPREAGAAKPSMESKLVKFADLQKSLPAGMRMANKDERKRQLSERLAEYMLRFQK